MEPPQFSVGQKPWMNVWYTVFVPSGGNFTVETDVDFHACGFQSFIIEGSLIMETNKWPSRGRKGEQRTCARRHRVEWHGFASWTWHLDYAWKYVPELDILLYYTASMLTSGPL